MTEVAQESNRSSCSFLSDIAQRWRAANHSSWGQIALGVCGAWEVAVDESLEDAERWSVQIDGPDVSVAFELDSLPVLEQAVRLMRGGPPRCTASESAQATGRACDGELDLGRLAGCSVRLIRDTESEDRCFVLIHAPQAGCVRLVLANDSRRQFSEALGQAAEELVSAGLIPVPSS